MGAAGSGAVGALKAGCASTLPPSALAERVRTAPSPRQVASAAFLQRHSVLGAVLAVLTALFVVTPAGFDAAGGLHGTAAHARDGESGGGGSSGSGSSDGGSDSSDSGSSDSGSSGSSSDGSGRGPGGGDDDGDDRDDGGIDARDEDDRGRDDGRNRSGRSVSGYLNLLDARGRVVSAGGGRRDPDIRYADGWRERVSGGRYDLIDRRGRVVVSRPATAVDRDRLSAARARAR